MSIVPQANRTKGEKKSWLLKGGGGHRPLPRKPENPWAGLTSYWLVYFFIGFHNFTCACAHFLGFCTFIGLSHFSLGDKKSWLRQEGGSTGLFLGSQRRYQVHQTIWKATLHSETGPEANKNGDTYVCITSRATFADTLSVSSERPMKGHLKQGCQVHQTIWKTTPHAEEQGLGAN